MKRYKFVYDHQHSFMQESKTGDYVDVEEIERLNTLLLRTQRELQEAQRVQAYWEKLVDTIGCAHIRPMTLSYSNDHLVITECVNKTLFRQVRDPREFIEHVARTAAEKLYRELMK